MATLEGYTPSFFARVDRSGDCWLWTGDRYPNGYPRTSAAIHPGGQRGAHRYAFQRFVGPIKDGLQINHLCEVKACVNPEHLEAVTPRENTMYSDTLARRNAEKAECIKGHPYDEENTYRLKGGRRTCLACKREGDRLRARTYRARRRQGA